MKVFFIVLMSCALLACESNAPKAEAPRPQALLPFKIIPKTTRYFGVSNNEKYIATSVFSRSSASASSRAQADAMAPGYEKRGYCTLFDKHQSYALSKMGWYRLIYFRANIHVKAAGKGSDDFQADEHLATLKRHCFEPRALEFSPDNSLLASGGGDSLVVIWDWKRNKRLAEFGSINKYRAGGLTVRKLLFNKTGDHLLALYSNNDVIVMNARTAKRVFNINAYQYPQGRWRPKTTERAKRNFIVDIAYSSDGQTIVIARRNGIGLFNAKTGKLIGEIKTPELNNLTALALDPKKDFLVAAVSDKRPAKLLIWRLSKIHFSKRRQSMRPDKIIQESKRRIMSLAISPQGRYLVSAGNDSQFYLYDLSNLRLTKRIVYEAKPTGVQVRFIRFGDNKTLYLHSNRYFKTNHRGQLIPLRVY